MDIFVKNLNMRWIGSKRIKKKFIAKYAQWLQHQYEITIKNSSGRGRPRKLFCESSDKTKSRDKSVFLLITPADDEKRSYGSSGKRKAAEVVKLATTATPKSLKRMKGAFLSTSHNQLKPYTPEESLALMIDLNLSKEQYILECNAKRRGLKIIIIVVIKVYIKL